MGGEVVILDLQSGTYYGLDAVGALIWTLLEQPASLDTLRDAILAEYDVDPETCRQDTLAFVEELQAAGLVEVSDAAVV
jgi:hypothetical protein